MDKIPKLPKGIRIDKGYIQVRIFHKGLMYCKNFGKESSFAIECAKIHLAEKRKEILLNKFTAGRKLESKKFHEVCNIYFNKWSQQLSSDGINKHTNSSLKSCKGMLNHSLLPFFGKMQYDSIRPSDIQRWRNDRLTNILGTSANREQAILSSLFSYIEAWVKTEQIKPFKLPCDPETGKVWNPAKYIEKAPNSKRERILTTQELQILKQACIQTNDYDMWEICKMALKSLLRKKDLMHLEAGHTIDINQAKTGNRINLPIQVLRPLNYINFRKRWEYVRKSAGLQNCQFRDLRKTGATLLKMKNHSNKLISEFLGHTNTDTTELYLVKTADHLKPLAEDLSNIVDSL